MLAPALLFVLRSAPLMATQELLDEEGDMNPQAKTSNPRSRAVVLFAALAATSALLLASSDASAVLCANRRGVLSLQTTCPATARVVDPGELGGARQTTSAQVYSGSAESILLGSWNGYAKITELSIPEAGSYTILAKATVDGMAPNDEASLLCELYPVPGADVHADATELSLLSGAGPALNTVSFNFVHTFTAAGKLELSCMTDSYIALRYLQITAVKVDSTSETPLQSFVQ